MINPSSDSSKSPFVSGQIVALDDSYGIFYGEVIQTVLPRKMCWVRAIAIAIAEDVANTLKVSYPDLNLNFKTIGNNLEIFSDSNIVLINLYRNVDLLFPLDLFRVAFDTEVLPLLEIIRGDSYSYPNDVQSSRRCLNWFLQKIWYNHRDKFKI